MGWSGIGGNAGDLNSVRSIINSTSITLNGGVSGGESGHISAGGNVTINNSVPCTIGTINIYGPGGFICYSGNGGIAHLTNVKVTSSINAYGGDVFANRFVC